MKRLYQCEICEQAYDTEAEAIACEAQGVIPVKLPVGTRIKVRERYPVDSNQPYVERVITGKFTYGHAEGYLLNKSVQMGKSWWAPTQEPNWMDWQDGGWLLTDEEFEPNGDLTTAIVVALPQVVP